MSREEELKKEGPLSPLSLDDWERGG